jgi:ribosomal protein S27E
VNDWLFGFGVGLNVAALAAFLLDRHFNRKWQRLVDKAFVRGADLTVKNDAAVLAKQGLPVHGFAVRCPECEKVSTFVISVRHEYCKCAWCGEQIPAPLATESEVAQ